MPTSFIYRWLSCSPDLSAGELAGPSDPATYTPAADDEGDVLALEVVAANAAGQSVAAFAVSSTVVAIPPRR